MTYDFKLLVTTCVVPDSGRSGVVSESGRNHVTRLRNDVVSTRTNLWGEVKVVIYHSTGPVSVCRVRVRGGLCVEGIRPCGSQ